MKTISSISSKSLHLIGDRVSARCRQSFRPGSSDVTWLPGVIIGKEGNYGPDRDTTRYVVQLDDNRRVVAFGDDVRRWTLSFDFLEKLAS